MSISKVWKKITDCAGQTFHTKTGVPFSYHIRNEYIYLENTNRAIPKRQVEESLSIRSDFVSDTMNGFFDLFIVWPVLLLSCVLQGRGLLKRGAPVRLLRGKKNQRV